MPCLEYKFFLTYLGWNLIHNYGYSVNEGYWGVRFCQVRLVADASEEHLGGDAGFFVLAQAMGEFTLGKLLVVLVHDERVVQVNGAFLAAKCFHERNLAGCGVADVFTTDDMCNLLIDVVDTNSELVGPLVVAVANREVAALEFRVFVEVPEAQVVPVDKFIGDDKAQVVRR